MLLASSTVNIADQFDSHAIRTLYSSACPLTSKVVVWLWEEWVRGACCSIVRGCTINFRLAVYHILQTSCFDIVFFEPPTCNLWYMYSFRKLPMPEKRKLHYLQRPCGHGRDLPGVHWWLVSRAKCNNYSLHMNIPKIQVSVFRICWNSTQEGMNWLFGHDCLCGASHSCLWPAHSPTRSEIRLGAWHLIALNLVGSRHSWEKGQTGTNLYGLLEIVVISACMVGLWVW